MPEGQVLEFTNVTKRFNEVTAVSDFSARVEPGAVTAFLGPNGAGKTTTLRILLGQVRATSGTATIGGVAYAELRQPLRTIGAVLEETAYRPRRTASRQLTIAAKANGIRLARVDEVISLVGLEGEADTRIGGFSLGMRQRLSVAHALLGDPGALVFDEPANGLDPEGIRWMRLLMRRLADEGRTVLVSSHVLSEIEQVADHVLVLSKGRLVLSSGIETLADPAGGSVVVDSVDRPGLTTALVAAGFDIEVLRSGLTVRGTDASRVGAVAADAGIALSTLVQRGPTLEDVFIDLMRGGRFDTAPALDQTESPTEADAEVEAESATDAEAPAEEAPTDAVSTDEAAAGTAAAALAAGGTAALADDLTTQATGPVTSGTIAADAAPTEQAEVEVAADEDATRALPVVAADADTTRILPVIDAAEDTQPAEAEHAEEGADTEAEDAPSFDDILFGAPAPAAESPRRSFAALFATASADAEAESSAQPAATDAPGETESETESPSTTETESESPSTTDDTPAEAVGSAADAPADSTSTDAPDGASGDEEPAGVEFFTSLDASSADDETAPSEDTAEATAQGEDASPASDDDPRSAAVSSMLAAAARAYYEDEPRDYPLAPAEETSSAEGAPQDEIGSDESADDTETAAEQHTPADDRGDEHHDDEHRD
ncbi:ATP-binding cassette domain-containing protein [Microbacterium sp. KSW4-4]|uniref:ATP-binding cassette domain-containing protein n=1 Tax=Microbacterium sp. KSW4-4 TaxID=2851651 RepID=UPI001FFC79CA|nr:ATP-binding cassette domain-containing protein [Microbacterium sp. KSW4-4]MCK2032965.1 ATP-binding cassette domain-containing protein [Microbacterium sp. KSW4-4]